MTMLINSKSEEKTQLSGLFIESGEWGVSKGESARGDWQYERVKLRRSRDFTQNNAAKSYKLSLLLLTRWLAGWFSWLF